jgi:hypothetical protein
MFIAAFIAEKGFPYQVETPFEAFASEEDATTFATSLARRAFSEAR